MDTKSKLFVGAGKAFRFYERFLALGGTYGQLKVLLKDDRVMREWVGKLGNVPETLEHGLFLKPRDQVERIRELNERLGWGFDGRHFGRALRTIPVWPKKKLAAVTLVPYLPHGTTSAEDFRAFKDVPAPGWFRTFAELIGILRSGWYGPGISFDDDTLASIDNVRLVEGVEHVPGLRWEVIDLGADVGRGTECRRSPADMPHAGILASLVLHPRWMERLGSEGVPYVNIPGYQFGYGDGEPEGSWSRAGVPQVVYNDDSHGGRGDVVGCAGIYPSTLANEPARLVATPRFCAGRRSRAMW